MRRRRRVSDVGEHVSLSENIRTTRRMERLFDRMNTLVALSGKAMTSDPGPGLSTVRPLLLTDQQQPL